MAIRDENGKIVSLKELKKKQKAPTKKELAKSLAGRKVWWIDKSNFFLYEGEIVKEVSPSIVKVKGFSRNINNRGEEVELELRIKDLQFNK